MCTFHVVKNTPVKKNGLPYYCEMIWTPELPELEMAGLPTLQDFKPHYEVSAKISDFDRDVYLDRFLASSEFVRLCQDLSCEFISVPAIVSLQCSGLAQKVYYFFCVSAKSRILDVAKSSYELMDEKLLRAEADRVSDVPVYERIESFVVREGIESNLFFCEEINGVVCSEKFRAEYESRGLSGIEFVALDNQYRYAPWDDFL